MESQRNNQPPETKKPEEINDLAIRSSIEPTLQKMFDVLILAGEWPLTDGKLAIASLSYDYQNKIEDQVVQAAPHLHDHHTKELARYIIESYSELLRNPQIRTQIIMEDQFMEKICKQVTDRAVDYFIREYENIAMGA